jgi:hypothetical protein
MPLVGPRGRIAPARLNRKLFRTVLVGYIRCPCINDKRHRSYVLPRLPLIRLHPVMAIDADNASDGARELRATTGRLFQEVSASSASVASK